MDAIGIALVKTLGERAMAPIVGNGTFVSGIAKGVLAFVIPTVGGNNKWTRIGSTAFMVDSAEDFVTAGMRMLTGGNTSGSEMVI